MRLGKRKKFNKCYGHLLVEVKDSRVRTKDLSGFLLLCARGDGGGENYYVVEGEDVEFSNVSTAIVATMMDDVAFRLLIKGAVQTYDLFAAKEEDRTEEMEFLSERDKMIKEMEKRKEGSHAE